jgi:hypothetical protein
MTKAALKKVLQVLSIQFLCASIEELLKDLDYHVSQIRLQSSFKYEEMKAFTILLLIALVQANVKIDLKGKLQL